MNKEIKHLTFRQTCQPAPQPASQPSAGQACSVHVRPLWPSLCRSTYVSGPLWPSLCVCAPNGPATRTQTKLHRNAGVYASSFEHHVLLLVRPVCSMVRLAQAPETPPSQRCVLHSCPAARHELKHQRAHRELEVASCGQSKPKLCIHGKHVASYCVASSGPYVEAPLFPVHQGVCRFCAALNLCPLKYSFSCDILHQDIGPMRQQNVHH